MKAKRPRAFALRSYPERGVELLEATMEQGRFDPHFHDTYLIGFTRSGVEAFVQGGNPGRSLPGQVRVIPPGVVHTGAPEGDEPWRYTAFYFAPELIDPAERGAQPAIFPSPVITDLTLFEAGLNFAAKLDGGDEQERDAAQAILLERLAAHRLPGSTTKASEPRKIAIARDYIRHRMAATIRLEEVAEAVGLSRFHLLRTFKAATGLTPWRYQVQLRLVTARELLRGGTPASQVAVICGFFDQSHFTRLFRASYGITPAAFAAAHHGKSRGGK